MFIKYIGHDRMILTEYNGVRYVFNRNIPVEISPEVYNNIVLSGHISAAEVMPCEETKVVEKPKETIVEKVKGAIKPKGKNKK